MAHYSHWFVSRQKRQLTTILQALVAYTDVCVGRVWNHELQLEYEDVLGGRSITEHGSLRARRAGEGGGGTRTLFKQMKDLGLVFLDEHQKCRLTLIAEELVKGNISFVDAMRIQLQKYQYPSAAVWTGSGSVDHEFKVHPFQFMFRLLLDERIGYITMDEMSGIIIHQAKSDNAVVYESVVSKILRYRQNIKDQDYVEDTVTKSFSNIANTFFNYISLTQYTDRGIKTLRLRRGKEEAAKAFVQDAPSFIAHPELSENYIRAYGRGKAAKDLRTFDRENALSQKELQEARIRHEYVLLALKTPITGITPDVVETVSNHTGIDERTVERFLIQAYPHGNIADFFLSYKELAYMGTSGATDFEKATVEMFRKIFGMRAEHVGPIGNTPDVFVESKESGYCGIIDNKAYKNGYNIIGDHKRRMTDEYIPNYQRYGQTTQPLAFFTYIAASFGNSINENLQEIVTETGVNGSAMPVDILINVAQDYAEKGYNHEYLKKIFSVNKEVSLSDL